MNHESIAHHAKRLVIFILIGSAHSIVGLAIPSLSNVFASEAIGVVTAHGPLEVSGVSILPDGRRYAVVGDDTETHGRIWPGGSSWKIKPKIKDPESLDIAATDSGEVLWLILGEEERLVGEPQSERARSQLGSEFRPICGRGLEGLSLRWKDGDWQAVVLWEGGYYDSKQCDKADVAILKSSPVARPKMAILSWEKGLGIEMISQTIELNVPVPPNGHFRATDLAWLDDNLVVLLGSTGKDGKEPYAHTWLQRFDLNGNQVGDPVKLEEKWGSFREGRNWEALDITSDGRTFVMGYDSKDGSSQLAVFANPFLKP